MNALFFRGLRRIVVSIGDCGSPDGSSIPPGGPPFTQGCMLQFQIRFDF